MIEKIFKQLDLAEQAHHQFRFCYSYYNHHTSENCSVANNNRIKNISNEWGLPYDHNLITSIPGYINASPMHFNKHSYIAAQGPRTNTFADFWCMVMEEKSSLIISVTNEQEEGSFTGFKFNRFWPEAGSASYGDVYVTLHSELLLKEWADGREEKIRERRYLVKKGSQETQVIHLHMENWPDNGVVHPESLVCLSAYADQTFISGPIVVHCAAGIGRTGTFIAFHSLFHDILDQLHRNENEPTCDLPGRIQEMRNLRWGAVVSDLDQYKLIIKALKLALK